MKRAIAVIIIFVIGVNMSSCNKKSIPYELSKSTASQIKLKFFALARRTNEIRL